MTLRLMGRYALLAVVAAIVLAPIYVTLAGSIQPADELLDYPRSLIPTSPTLSPYADAWRIGNLDRYLVNSLLVSTLITIGQLATCTLAAYTFAFIRFRGRGILFAIVMASLLIPTEVTVIGNYKTIQSLNWVNTYPALVVPFLTSAFGIFLLRQVFRTVPNDLRDAATMDGVGHVRFLWDTVVPLARPALGALGVFAFLGAWNQYLWPLLATNDDSMRTVQIGLRSLSQSTNLDSFNRVMAGTIIAALPIFLVLLFFQRQLIRGLTAGAVKG